MEYEFKTVPIEDIQGFFFERSYIDQESTSELAKNLKEHGVIAPIILRQLDKNVYQVVAGFRRFNASVEAGFKTIEAKIATMDDVTAANVCLSENIHTKEMSKVDQAKLLKKLLDAGLTQAKISLRLSKSKAWVSSTLKLLDTDVETQKSISEGLITAEHASILDKLPQKQQRERLIEKIKDEGLSVKQTDKEVEKSISRMDIDKKVTTLTDKVNEYVGKIDEAKNAASDVETMQKRMSAIEAERKKLSKKIKDEGIKQKSFSLEIVDSKIKPLDADIKAFDAEIITLEGDFSKIDIGHLEREHKKLSKKEVTAAAAIEKAKKVLDDAIKQHQTITNSLKPVTADIREYQRLSKRIDTTKASQGKKVEQFDELIKVHEDVYKNYDLIRSEVDKHSKNAENVMELTKEFAELSAKVPKLRGLANNLTRFEDVLKKTSVELEKLKVLAV